MSNVEAGTGLVPQPRLRPSVRLGEVMHDGARPCVFVTDLDTGLMLRVGERERFLLARLDGSTGQKELSDASLARYGVPVAPEQWQALVAMLWARGLLDGVPATDLDVIRKRVVDQRASEYTLLHRRFPIRGAESVLPTAQALMGWLFHPVALALGTLLGVAACVAALVQLPALLTAVLAGNPRWALITLTIAISFGVVILHELGHGVACRRYGGTVQEFGLLWRAPILAPYCKVDSVMVLARWQRVAVSFAGIHVNLLALVPFWLLTILCPSGSFPHALGAALLLAGIPSALVNLIPIFFLDGHRMFEHATGIHRIAHHALALAGAALPGRRAVVAAFPKHVMRWTAVYLLLATATLALFGGWMVSLWWTTLANHWGPWVATGLLVGEAGLIVGLLAIYHRWKSSRA